MRGGFLIGTIVGAAATAYFMSRRNNMDNVNRLSKMVTSAISDGFKMTTATSASNQTANQTSTNNKAQASKATGTNKQEDEKMLKKMIAQDAAVQKEVNEIIAKHSH